VKISGFEEPLIFTNRHQSGEKILAGRSVVIVGAGIFGVAAALELRRRGWEVSLIDPGPLPHPEASSTDISKVIRADYGADEFYTELMEVCIPRWREWNSKWGEELYHEVGFLIMSSEEMRPESFEYESYQLLRRRGHAVERINSKKLSERFPAWNSKKYVDGYFNPVAGWAASGAVVAKLVQEARAKGVRLVEGKLFACLIESDSRVTGIETRDGERILGDYVIVSSGAWTPALLPHLADVMWTVGQPVLYFSLADPFGSPYNHVFDIARFQPPQFACWAADIAKTGWYGFPALDDGTLKIGNHGPGFKMHADDKVIVPPEHETRCRIFLEETFPEIANAPVGGSRVCRYCDTWDGNFYIDHDPSRPGLFVAAGGSGHAFKFGPVLGEIIADRIEGKEPP